jgi:hypothetical protein
LGVDQHGDEPWDLTLANLSNVAFSALRSGMKKRFCRFGCSLSLATG